MIADYHPAAAAELFEAAVFYEQRVIGLGQRFLDVVDQSVAKLEVQPGLAPPDGHGRRRYLVHEFPYLVVFGIDGEFLHVLTIAHTSRKPGYWATRE